MNYLTIIGYIVIPLCSILVVPLVRSFFGNLETRLKTMESHIALKVTEADVRQLVDDKLEPVKERLDDIKASLENITNHLIKN